MLIVMPYGETNATGGGSQQGIAALQRELIEDIVPLIEKRYRVLTGRENRAIAGRQPSRCQNDLPSASEPPLTCHGSGPY
jgi:hypothetical protein